MPKNNVSDLITDQEMTFVRLVLSGTMTDREAAEAAGLNPDTAAYTKSKPRVRAHMLEHRAATQQQILQQEAGLSQRAEERQRRREQRREQVLDRLWEISIMSPEITRGSLTGQVKALSMIVAIEGLVPDRRSSSSAMFHPAAPQVPEPEPAHNPAPNQPATSRFPALTPTNPPHSIPSSTPQSGLPAQPSSMLCWTKPVPSALSFPPDQRI
jgi:hypothetical protein